MVTALEIEHVIPFTRSACDGACEDLQSNRPQHCNVTSDVLVIGLHWLALQTLNELTSYIPTPDPVDPEAGHLWLRWNGSIAIDATASQFSEDLQSGKLWSGFRSGIPAARKAVTGKNRR